MALQFPQKNIPLPSVVVSIEDIKRVYSRLAGHVAEQAEREISALKKGENQSDEDFENYKTLVREQAFRVTVTIKGADGTTYYGETEDAFDSPNRPDKVTYVYITNTTAYKVFAKVDPTNSFELYLDFSKPPLLDGNNPVSSPTVNVSHLNVNGDRDSWVAAISDAVMGVLDNRKTQRSALHGAFVYDYGLLLFGFPLGFYLCWRFSSLIDFYFDSISPFLSAAVYLYVVMIALWAYRIFFGYTKWAFPRCELLENKDSAKKHRAFWYVIMLGIIVNLIWVFVS